MSKKYKVIIWVVVAYLIVGFVYNVFLKDRLGLNNSSASDENQPYDQSSDGGYGGDINWGDPRWIIEWNFEF